MDARVSFILRVGLAFAFLFPPLNALLNPYAWIGYFPEFTRGFVPDEVLLHAFGVVEVALALWLLSGKRIFTPSALMFLMFISIVAFNPGQFEVLFRDLSLAAMALALAMVSFRHEWRGATGAS
jgi:hypothetical protein